MPQRRVMITGAGSGLGRALAERYAAAGWAIACADIHAGRAAETVPALTGQGHFPLAVADGADDRFRARTESRGEGNGCGSKYCVGGSPESIHNKHRNKVQ